jgi:hypothetical protein
MKQIKEEEEEDEQKKEIFKINNVTQTNNSTTLDLVLQKNNQLYIDCDTLKKECKKLEAKVVEQKEQIEQLYKKNQRNKVDYKEYDNFKLSMACVDILNKGLLFFLIIYMLTATSLDITKIYNIGFTFYDWIVFFICLISISCKAPILYSQFKND